jgi:hypothetical protein
LPGHARWVHHKKIRDGIWNNVTPVSAPGPRN